MAIIKNTAPLITIANVKKPPASLNTLTISNPITRTETIIIKKDIMNTMFVIFIILFDYCIVKNLSL